MAIEFKKFLEFSKFLDPANNFAEKDCPIEFRIDPLTKDMGFVRKFRWRQLEKPDLSGLIAKSLERECPFCPENIDKITPKFIPDFYPEGRIKIGETTIFPNTTPYSPYSAITVISSRHFVGLPDFTQQMLFDALTASQIYLKRAYEYDPKAKYCCIVWNYLPSANSSQLHPHLQAFAGYFPLVYNQVLLDTSKQYHNGNGTVFWSNFIAEEKKLQERYIATLGNTVWLTSFVPRALQLDILAVFQGTESILSIPQEDIESFCYGLTKIFKYMDDQNFCSFNLCLYSGTIGEDSFWTQARIIQRGTFPPLDTSDVGNMHLLFDTRPAGRYPETVCRELKAYFT